MLRARRCRILANQSMRPLLSFDNAYMYEYVHFKREREGGATQCVYIYILYIFTPPTVRYSNYYRTSSEQLVVKELLPLLFVQVSAVLVVVPAESNDAQCLFEGDLEFRIIAV